MLSMLEAAVESYSNGDTKTTAESSVSLQVISDFRFIRYLVKCIIDQGYCMTA
jgi:hypothetical protein